MTMDFSGAPALLALYYLVLGVLACFGLHRFYLVLWYRHTRHRHPEPPPAPQEWPMVTVQLPLYNEVYVAPRLIAAVCALDYPRDRLEIQVLDDSTDETAEAVAQVVAAARARGIDIVHLRRADRTGFKAGALAAGLAVARGSLVAIFDADFVPDPDFLRRSVPWFADPGLALVQGRWSHINRSYSLLTHVQAILLDGHFLVEHAARHRSGCFFNFNGTAGIWRRAAIDDAGGWTHDTLTEDLDLSFRAQLRGWRFLYLPDLTVPSELPVDVNGFKNQQYRWAKGSVQTGRKLLGRVLRARLPWRVKLEALIQLTNNFTYTLMVLLAVLVFPAMLIQKDTATLWRVLALDVPLFFGATVSVLVFYLVSQSAGGLDWRKQLRYLPTLMGLGLGLSVNNALAVLSGCTRMGGTFHRTPKYKIERMGEDWVGKRYRSGRNLAFPIEVAFALYFIACTVYALALGMWPSLPFLGLFVYGFSYMAFLSLVPALRGWRLRQNGA